MLTWFDMDKLPESTVPANTLWELVNVTGKPHVLKHAIDFKIFNHLSASISAEEVAERLGRDTRGTAGSSSGHLGLLSSFYRVPRWYWRL